uniref:Glomulin n=1 Tax=Aceria tosichella TaxID=561515 RepID=A0A6G1S410_9ACAR
MDYYQFAAKKDFEVVDHGRNRGQQQAPDPNDPPIKRIKFYLDKYKIKEALQIFFHSNTLKLLSEESDFMWDIIPMICSRLRGLCQYRFRVFEGCERMLCRIAVEESCNPKEVLIGLLAEINQSGDQNDDNVFRAMIRPLEGTLLRMNSPSPREENFRWTLNVLMRHLNDIELPQEYNIEGKKRLSLPNDPSVKRFIEVLPLMLNFIEEFNDKPTDYDKSPMPILTESQIDEVLNGELVDDGDFMNDVQAQTRCDITDASITALLHIIQRPFTYLDTTNYCKELKLTAMRCLSLLLKLLPDLFAPIYKRLLVNNSTTMAMSDQMLENSAEIISANISSLATNHFDGSNTDAILTLATCAYLFRCENRSNNTSTSSYPLLPPSASSASSSPQPVISSITPISLFDIVQSFPQILTHESLLFCHLPYVVVLLKRSEILAHEKGLLLISNLLALIEHNSLGRKFYELSKASSLMEQLFQIMVYSPLCINRRRAYEIFSQICDLLTFDCKLDMFKWILRQTELRPCIRAACIDQYRKHLNNIYRELMRLYQQLALVTNNDNCCEIMKEINMWQSRYKLIGGQALVEFLELCISACLPESQHTDIIENYELLLATLTMFRYLRLRKTLVKDDAEQKYLCDKELKKNFFDPVRSAVALVMNELKLHHKEQINKAATTTATTTKSADETTAGEQTDEIECLNYVLCRLDLVESVLVRTCDLYNC